MSCNNPQTITERIICAKTCTEKMNDSPIAKLSFSGTTVYDSSQYFDSGNVSQRQIRWKIYTEEILVYEFGYNDYNLVIPELGNGSTYGLLNLGLNNQDILTFLQSLPNTIIPNDTEFKIYIDVADSTDVISQNISNVFIFTS